jgi:hypothetical protein
VGKRIGENTDENPIFRGALPPQNRWKKSVNFRPETPIKPWDPDLPVSVKANRTGHPQGDWRTARK